jgi:hypothetical protein
MPRAKKSAQLSAKERANRLDRLSEEEIKRLTTQEIFAYFKLIDKADSRAVRRPDGPSCPASAGRSFWSGKKKPRLGRGFKVMTNRVRPVVTTAERKTHDARFRRSRQFAS